MLVLEQADMIHRDLRVDNVLVADDGAVKIADFGLGKVLYACDDNKGKYVNFFTISTQFHKRIVSFSVTI